MQIDIEADRTMRATARRTPRRPWLPLLSALMDMSRGQAQLIRHQERSWASVTFSGTRHAIVLAFTGEKAMDAAESFIAALPDYDFAIPRQIVADANIVRVEHTMAPQPRMEVEADLLLIEDC